MDSNPSNNSNGTLRILLITLAIVALIGFAAAATSFFIYEDFPIRLVWVQPSATSIPVENPTEPAVTFATATPSPPGVTATPLPPTATSPANQKPQLTTNTDLNVRSGPGIDYTILDVMPAGETAAITGVSEDSRWWQIRYSNAPNEGGWVSAQYVAAENIENVPVVPGAAKPALPSPTPTPTPSATPSGTATPLPTQTFTPIPPTPVPNTPVPLPTSTPRPRATPTATRPHITEWHGQYWPNRTLSGNPAFERNDETINFRWGAGGPVPGASEGTDFSARWSRWLTFDEGSYSLKARADDGIRVYVDNRLVLNEWHGSDARDIYSVDLDLDGRHLLIVEYYEQAGAAQVEFWWEEVTPTSLPTDTPTATHTPTGTATFTATPTQSPTGTSTASATATFTATATASPTLTATATFTATATASPTLTATATITATATASPTLTATATTTATATASPTLTATATITATQTATATVTPTGTPVPVTTTPTATPTIIPTQGVRADFVAAPLRGTVPLTVTFANSSTHAGSYHWAFGDGSTSTQINPIHSYTQAGLFSVSLTAGDGVLTDTLNRADYIQTFGPLDPQAVFSAVPTNGTTPLTVTFSNTSRNATIYRWNFGDGSPPGSQISPTHVFTRAGVFTVTLTAGDGAVTDTLIVPNNITVSPPVSGSLSAILPRRIHQVKS